MDSSLVFDDVEQTPVSVILYEAGADGRRQIYSDLKDIQQHSLDPNSVIASVQASDVCVLCNSEFNRALLSVAHAAGKKIATDVHMLNDIHDEFNADFMRYADILFLSDEDLPVPPREFLVKLKKEYAAEIIVIGLGEDGALLYERATDKITALDAVDIGGVINTIGAGDAMFTAFNHYYLRGEPAVEALKRAEVFAALKIRHDGGAVGFATEAQVEELYKTYKFVCVTE